MYNKKILTVFIFLFTGFLSHASGQLELSPPENVVLDSLSGTQVVIPLNLTNTGSESIDAFGLKFTYPTKLLSFTETDNAGTLTDSWITSGGQENTPGEIIVGGFNPTPATNSGVLLNVIFEVTSEPGSDSLKLTNFADDIAGAATTPGTVSYTVVSVQQNESVPSEFSLMQNYPNPFNPTTTIRYELPVSSYVVLTVYNILGQEIRTLVNAEQTAGVKTVVWDAADTFGRPAVSGIYFYKIEAGDFSRTLKLMLMK